MDYLAIAVAGFLGAVTRAALGKAITAEIGSPFPFSTLIINISGCLVLSVFLTVTLDRFQLKPNIRLAVGTGFLGAYTTFSTFALEAVNLMRGNMIGSGLVYVAATLGGCVTAAWLGLVLGRLMSRPVPELDMSTE
ncbi:MAG TPA: fluoride efflux transporter CrcB [Bacillota bacterium]|nr:fluoride efflux transporter CrcB [Bacillota bacterium]